MIKGYKSFLIIEKLKELQLILEDVVKEYRLQLDVKTTRRKAREIEKYLRETLERMI